MFAPLPFRLTRPTIAGPGENLGARRYELGRDEDRGQLRPRRTNAPRRGARGAQRGEGRRRLPIEPREARFATSASTSGFSLPASRTRSTTARGTAAAAAGLLPLPVRNAPRARRRRRRAVRDPD